MSCSVVVKSEEERSRPMSTLPSGLVLINVVSQVDNIVVVVFSRSITVNIKVPRSFAISSNCAFMGALTAISSFRLTIVTARKYGKSNLINTIIATWSCFRPSKGTLVLRAADRELIEVCCEGPQALGLDLH